jgi:hypothetical protein
LRRSQRRQSRRIALDILLDSRLRSITSWNSCGLRASFASISIHKTIPIISGITASLRQQKAVAGPEALQDAFFNLG